MNKQRIWTFFSGKTSNLHVSYVTPQKMSQLKAKRTTHIKRQLCKKQHNNWVYMIYDEA